MVTLFEQDLMTGFRNSSKGNQLKWQRGDIWYKADYLGYEGLAEYIISKLLQYSDLEKAEYVDYETEMMGYGRKVYTGCKSRNFLPSGWQLITLERLFQTHYQESLYKKMFHIENVEKRLEFLVDYVVRMTGLKEFGVYMSKLMTIDALFLNEDRHTHNIAVLLDPEGNYHYCPAFDHGAGLMADTVMDYPLNVPVYDLFGSVQAKTFSMDFDEQLDAAEALYGRHIWFSYSRREVFELLKKEEYYPENVKERVYDILMEQKRKYQYLFVVPDRVC